MSSTEPEQRAAGRAVRAGVIGLGMIGGGVAVSLAHSGITPVVYDVRPDAAQALPGVPGQAASPAQVAQESDVVLIAVLTAGQAMAVLAGDDGVLSAGRDGLIVALLSTVSIRELRELAGICARHGVTLLDAGVTPGPAAASNGLVVMVGGPDEAVTRARPVLDGFAKEVVHCGPQGAGMVAKLARNVLTYSIWAAAREAATIAEAGGVPLDRLLQVLEAGGTEPLSWLRRQAEDRPITEEHADFIDGLAQKDLAAAQDFAGEAGIEAPLADIARPQMRRVFGGQLLDPLPEGADARGRAMMDRVFGDSFSARIPADGAAPWSTDTVEHLFGQIWSRPYLTTRDRRLMVIGATTMLGSPTMLELHIRGAIANGELTPAQLREIGVFLPYYTGWGNANAVKDVITKLLAEADAAAAPPAPIRPAALGPDGAVKHRPGEPARASRAIVPPDIPGPDTSQARRDDNSAPPPGLRVPRPQGDRTSQPPM